MTNDTTTLNGALRELGELMATNLETMGVEEVSADDGLMTLVGKVLDVEPSIKGLELSLNLDLSSDKHIVDENEQFTLNATFIGSYDDETQEDVDLFGVITGATILFKDVSNDVVLCSRVTGLDGSIEVSLVNDFNEDVEIMAIFEGTENFDSCNSDSINLYQIRSMVLSSDKEELPKEAGETVLMTATVVGNVNGCSVKWYNDDTDELLGTTTFTNNISQYTFLTTGGDVMKFRAVLVKNNFALATERLELSYFEEYYNEHDISVFNGMNLYGDYMGVYNDNSYVSFKTPIKLPSSWKISWVMINTRSNSAWCMANIGVDQSHEIRIGKLSRTTAGAYLTGTTVTESDSISSNVEYPMSITYKNGEYNLVYNGHNMVFTDSIEPEYLLGFGLAGYRGNGARIKNIKVELF